MPLKSSRLPDRRLARCEPEHPILAPSAGTLRVAKRFRRTAGFLRNSTPPEYPVYGELALDAIEARETDPRKAILFAAFAVEQMARANLESAYTRARNAPVAETWHWVTRQVTKGQVVRKDPIFERLLKASRVSFGVLLVELPLYAFGRSMLDDNKSLYDWLRRLHSTRNALSHQGEPNDESMLQLTREGASLALSIASAAFAWFNEVNYFYFLPQQWDEDPDFSALLAGSDEFPPGSYQASSRWRYTGQ